MRFCVRLNIFCNSFVTISFLLLSCNYSAKFYHLPL
nr:MAG TPA: hypothetical protein [Bacteriophage sp.]